MKIKEFDKYMNLNEYKQGLSDIQIGIDDTDHITFFCPKCSKAMKVLEVFSKKIVIDLEKNKDNCTWILLVCKECKRIGQRKFYWESEDGRFCRWNSTVKHFRKELAKEGKSMEIKC